MPSTECAAIFPLISKPSMSIYNPGCTLLDIKQRAEVPIEYEGRFLKSKADLDYCGIIGFKIELKPNAAPVASRSHRRDPVISKQADEIADTHFTIDII